MKTRLEILKELEVVSSTLEGLAGPIQEYANGSDRQTALHAETAFDYLFEGGNKIQRVRETVAKFKEK